MRHSSFAPVASPDARILILGSLPGAESLRRGQYYANQRNAFWPIMGSLVGAGPELPYDARLQHLMACGIALWDVCRSAERDGSLDTAICAPVANPFAAFFRNHRRLRLVCFNGQAAAQLFARVATPGPIDPALRFVTLPSTSPAHAAMPLDDKRAHWRAVIAAVQDQAYAGRGRPVGGTAPEP